MIKMTNLTCRTSTYYYEQKFIFLVCVLLIESKKGVNAGQISLVESQKVIIIIQRYSVENQKGTITVQSLWQ